MDASEWSFEPVGPLLSANGHSPGSCSGETGSASRCYFPNWNSCVTPKQPIAILAVWRPETLASPPAWAFGLVTALDRALVAIAPETGSFVDVELVKRAACQSVPEKFVRTKLPQS